MRPIRYALLALLLLAAPAWAAPVKGTVALRIDGDTVVVVRSLPCTVTAPFGADLYFWTLPDGVKGTSAENVLTITAATAGDSTIGVVSLTIDFDLGKDGKLTKTTRKDNGSIVLTNGAAPPVPPTPVGPLAATLQAAYASDPDPAKAANVKLLAALYRNAPVADTALATYGDLFGKLSAARKVLLADSAIPGVRKAAGGYLNATLGTDPSAAVDRVKAGAAFAKLASILEGVK